MICDHAVRRPAEHGMRSNGPYIGSLGWIVFGSSWRKIERWYIGTLLGTNISAKQGISEDYFPFSKVGYVSSLEGIHL